MKEPQILVIEDDAAISELICMNLEAAGYRSVPIMDGKEAECLLNRRTGEKTYPMTKDDGKRTSRPGELSLPQPPFSLALVDVMLPGKDGFALMEDLKAVGIPVIYLTARSDVLSRVHGLKSGAEDYIVKPFEVLELLVRIEKVLSRTGRSSDILRIRDVQIDRREHSVTKAGIPVALKPMEYELLVTLAANKNVAFTRQQLLEQVWGSDYLGETRTVDVHIGCLRKKLGFHEVIRTIPKTGYRLED